MIRLEQTWREAAVAALAAGGSAALVIALGPPPVDEAAHLYRTLLSEHGVYFWDNLWYGGQYPFVSYGFLYYPPASVVGNVPLVVAAAVACAALFASLVVREWGDAAVWPARLFGAVSAAAPLLTGTYSYALGLAALLGCLKALQLGRTWLALACAALTLGFSPLAFGFLVLVLAAILLARRSASRPTLLLAGGLGLLTAAEIVALAAFGDAGVYPFGIWTLLGILITSALGTALALNARHGRVLAALFLLWGLASIAVFVVPTPVGGNITRLRFAVLPLGFLTAALAGYRPRLLAVAGVTLACVYNVVPYVGAFGRRSESNATQAAFWTPALEFLRARSSPDYRVEVVPTWAHSEVYWLPRAGFALARGWYRQLDVVRNPVFYRGAISPGTYRDWLREEGVRFVLLPDTGLDGYGGGVEEERLLRSGRSGLVEIRATPGWRIYELPRAVPILTGAGPARITALGHERVEGWTGLRGTYTLRIRYTPYWRVAAGGACLERAPDGMTRVRVRSPGRFVLEADGDPRALVSSLLGRSKARC